MTRSFCLALALASIAAPVSAQSLEEAQHQLDIGHAAAAAEMATALVDQGTRVGTDLAPLYRVLGLASATAGNEDAAREAFTRWLALDPEGRLDRSLPDEVRSPFLEARGFWASSGQRLGAQATLRADASGLDVSITDPASMVARVRVRVRPAGGAWSDVMRSPAPSLAIDVPGLSAARALDYSITFLDVSGNRIWHDGSDDAPLHAGEAAHTTTTVETTTTTTPGTPESAADPTGFVVGAVIAGVIAAGAVITAAIFHADRERLAGIYNGDGSGCTGSGTTRGDVCAPQRSAISTDEVVAGVLYGVAGAAAITAIVLALMAPSSPSADHAAVSCGAGPGQFGLACGGSF